MTGRRCRKKKFIFKAPWRYQLLLCLIISSLCIRRTFSNLKKYFHLNRWFWGNEAQGRRDSGYVVCVRTALVCGKPGITMWVWITKQFCRPSSWPMLASPGNQHSLTPILGLHRSLMCSWPGPILSPVFNSPSVQSSFGASDFWGPGTVRKSQVLRARS